MRRRNVKHKHDFQYKTGYAATVKTPNHYKGLYVSEAMAMKMVFYLHGSLKYQVARRSSVIRNKNIRDLIDRELRRYYQLLDNAWLGLPKPIQANIHVFRYLARTLQKMTQDAPQQKFKSTGIKALTDVTSLLRQGWGDFVRALARYEQDPGPMLDLAEICDSLDPDQTLAILDRAEMPPLAETLLRFDYRQPGVCKKKPGPKPAAPTENEIRYESISLFSADEVSDMAATPASATSSTGWSSIW